MEAEWTHLGGHASYPAEWLTRRVSGVGNVRVSGDNTFLSTALAGQLVGLWRESECGDDIIQVIKEALQDEDVRVRLDAVKFAVPYLYGRPGLFDDVNALPSLGTGDITAETIAEAQALLTGNDPAAPFD